MNTHINITAVGKSAPGIEEKRCVKITNCPNFVTKETAMDWAEKYGPVRSIFMQGVDHGLRRDKIIYVLYEDSKDANDAVSRIDGNLIFEGQFLSAEHSNYTSDA